MGSGLNQLPSGAVLETLVPHASEINLEEALGSSSQDDIGESSSILSSIKQRSLLFFDELVTVYAVLRLTNCSEDILESQLPRLAVQLEAFAVDGEGPAEGGENESPQPTKDIIFQGSVSETEDPLVIVNEADGDDGVKNYVYVIWKLDAFLNRPRVRLQHPSVIFQASATLNPPKSLSNGVEDEYLPSRVPASVNVFQPLSGTVQDTTLPYLPASRLLRVVPASQEDDFTYNIRQITHHPIRVIPIASARIRYSRVNTFSSKPTMIASLDFEVTPFTNFEVTLEKADLMFYTGKAESLTGQSGFGLPVTCRPKDDVTLVYKLTQEYEAEAAQSTTAAVSVVDISLAATISVSDDCHPKIIMQWRTNVDFSMPLNPNFGAPSQVMQRSSRPSSLSMGSTQRPETPASGTGAPNRRSYLSSDIGVTISFSAPVRVEVGKAFYWDIFIVNRSQKARRFAMAAIPRRKRTDTRKHIARPSSSSVSSRKEDLVAEAVTDENILYAMQKNATPYETELICLSTDVRIGPLQPGTCHSTELKFLPLAAGPLHVEAVRLVDLNTNEPMDIRDLPDIVAFHKQNG